MAFKDKNTAILELNNLVKELKNIFDSSINEYWQKATDTSNRLTYPYKTNFKNIAANISMFKVYLNGGKFYVRKKGMTYMNRQYLKTSTYSFEGSIERRITALVKNEVSPYDMENAETLLNEMNNWKSLMMWIKRTLDTRSTRMDKSFALYSMSDKDVTSEDRLNKSFFKTAILVSQVEE